MADRQAADPFALSPGWTLQILLWDLGATALFLSRAIDIGAGRGRVMKVQKALGRFALWIAWTIQVTIWALGATALFLSAAIDIGEKRYPIYFTYTTPLYLNDVLDMITLARPVDFLVPTRANFFLWLFVLSALVLILDRKQRIRTGWRTIIIVPQAYIFGMFAFFGFISLFSDLPRLWSTRLDGEWLGEGWNGFEASVLWLPTILILLFQPLLVSLWRSLWRTARASAVRDGVPFRP